MRILTKLLTSVALLLVFTRSSVLAVGLYEPWEKSFTNSKSYSNKFDFGVIELEVQFVSPTGEIFDFFGFYDGNGSGGQMGNVWKIRFMPDEMGPWNYTYSWSDGTSGGSGNFSVGENTNPKIHGHIHRDPNNPRYLIYDDGTAHYFYGANWIDAYTYGPRSKWGQTNRDYVSNTEFTSYLDILEGYGHNGILIKTAFYPLEDDKFTWDIEWMSRGEWLVSQMADRGIYAQINVFDTWARGRGGPYDDTSGSGQVFNVWANGDEAAKENYIKYLIARYAGFPNVYWELGNEMEHSPNSGSAFVNQANSKYIPWFTEHDPYDLPIGLSEGIWTGANVDIGFPHQTNSLPSSSWSKPTIMNELVRGGVSGSLWENSAIRNSSNRISYRRTFWRMFTYGGSGSSEATWLENWGSLNQAVKDVMGDQQRLRNFIEDLPTHINQMDTDSSFVTSGPGTKSTRRQSGEAYVTYFLLNPNQSVSAGSVGVNLPSGSYKATWYDPKDGSYTAGVTIPGGSSTPISYPGFTEDIVLRVLKDDGGLPTPTPTSGPSPTPYSTPTPGPEIIQAGSLAVVDAANAADWSIESGLAIDDLQYGDRTMSLDEIPPGLVGSWWIKTANDSKSFTGGDIVSLTLNHAATIYIALDDRIVSNSLVPSWLSSWSPTTQNLSNNTAEGNYTLYSKSFSAGATVTLGQNSSNGTGTSSMYTVIAVADATASILGDIHPLPSGDGDVDILDYQLMMSEFGGSTGSPGDINGDGTVNVFDFNILIGNFGS